MAELRFQDLSFEDKRDKVKVAFLRIFYLYISKSDLKKIGDFTVKKNGLEFQKVSQERAQRKFWQLLGNGFMKLRNSINGKKTIYVHRNSSIPLIGNVGFGLIDRDTNIIEIKPITGCNLRCVYCSVDDDKRPVDFVVEKEYLLEELRKIVRFKGIDGIEAHIASQGEPLLYAPLDELISDISKIKEIRNISIDTNGTMLNQKKVDALVRAGLTRFNLSINSFDEKKAREIAGTSYDIEKIKGICRYIARKANLIITPVYIPTINEKEMPKIILFAKKIKADIGIQNFLNYRLGRNPVKEKSFDDFYVKLKKWEEMYKVKLIKSAGDFNIIKTKAIPKPFKKGDIIEAEILCEGRLKNEMLASAEQRTISIPECHRKNGRVRVKITRSKHNIFVGAISW